MSEVLRTDDFVLREVDDADAPLIFEWQDEDDEEIDFFDAETQGDLLRLFQDRRAEGREVCCVVEHNGRPLGYVQFYPSLFWFELNGDVPDERPWGIDVFIGDPADRDRGLGSRLVREVALYLLREREATRVIIDPETDNLRAIRSYEKAGFRRTRLLPADGEWPDTWLMEFEPAGDP